MTFRSVPWTSQPQWAVGVDWSNPITRGLTLALLPNYEAVAGVDASGDQTAYNDGLYTKGTTCYIPASHPFYSIKNGHTILCVAKVLALIDYAALFICSYNAAGTAPYVALGFTAGASTAVSCGQSFVAYNSSSFDAIQSSTGYFVVSDKQQVFANTRSGTNASFYIGGVFSHNESGLDVSPDFVNRRPIAMGAVSKPVALTLAFSRVLSASEIRSLSANPWQIFQPRKLPIFVDIPVDHNIYAYTDESATTNETSEYPSTGSVFNDGSQDTTSSAESSSVLVNLNAASIEPSTSQESSTSQAALQAARVESNASQESSTSQATLQSVLTESNASQDTQTQGATSSNTTTDTNSVTDSSTKVYTAQTTINDTNNVVDTQTAQAQLYAARSEVNNALDSILALAQLYAAKTESSSATETSTQGASSSNTTTDSTSVTDSSTRAYTAQATLSDSITSTDNSAVQAQFYAAKTETATMLDSLLAQASLLAVKLETASPTDSRNTSTTFVAAQLNTVNIIDTYAAIASLTAQLHTISNSIEVLLGNSISSANTLEITTALDDFYALLEQLIYQLSQVVFMNETLAFTLIPISRTTSLRAETRRNTTFNSSIRLNQFLATKPITTYIRT
jgi:hypothetical protein